MGRIGRQCLGRCRKDADGRPPFSHRRRGSTVHHECRIFFGQGGGVRGCCGIFWADGDPINSDLFISRLRYPIERKIEANCSPAHPVSDVIWPMTDESIRYSVARAPNRSPGLALHDCPADYPRETFNDIDPHNSLAARPISGNAIALPRYSHIEQKRGPARRCGLGKRSEERARVVRRLKTPQLEGEGPCCWLNQDRYKNVISAETHTMLSKLRSLVLGERLDLSPDRLCVLKIPRDRAAAAQIANDLRSFLQSLELKRGAENASRHCRKPKVNSRLYNVLRCNWQGFVDQHYSCGSKHACATRQSGDRVSQRSNDAIVRKHNRGIRRCDGNAPRLSPVQASERRATLRQGLRVVRRQDGRHRLLESLG